MFFASPYFDHDAVVHHALHILDMFPSIYSNGHSARYNLITVQCTVYTVQQLEKTQNV